MSERGGKLGERVRGRTSRTMLCLPHGSVTNLLRTVKGGGYLDSWDQKGARSWMMSGEVEIIV